MTTLVAEKPTHTTHPRSLGTLSLGALGIVFGDIGTSPLYALKECVHGPHGVAPSAANVLGIVSLIFWSLLAVVTVKYLVFIMRADNHGEGGILALLALAPKSARGAGVRIGSVAAAVLFGAALLYGDGMITPAISVLSAMEGLEVATPAAKDWILPLTIAVLVALFAVQSRGTERIGRVFGPIMLLWFLTIGVLGAAHLVREPAILRALSPGPALAFFVAHGWHGVVVLGSVVLVLTGGEALYADMGHFGARPIRVAWYTLALPSLLLCYFGQGALLLRAPSAASNPFFAMAPEGPWIYPLVALAAAATIIASQALISGVFSLTRQAVQLGYFPRVTIQHTSEDAEGQIYVPEINWGLAIACITLVLVFRESSRLAAAFGIAVTGTMAITSIVYYVVVRRTWGWSLVRALPLVALFLCFDLAFFGANLLKVADGGWVPLVVAAILFGVMVTWHRGRALLVDHLRGSKSLLADFAAEASERVHTRVPGTAVFLASTGAETPPTMLHHVRHNKILHDRVFVMTVLTEPIPRVDRGARLEIARLPNGITRIIARVGFMETPDVPQFLRDAAGVHGVEIDEHDLTYYLGHETLLATERGQMGRSAETLFSFLMRNSPEATAYFKIPPERVVELGMQLDL